MSRELTSAHATALQPYEADLVERAKSRSAEAWTEIYNTHYQAIYRYIRARVFDGSTAEDLASAVFVAALQGIDSYQYRGRPILAWLYRIARNQVVSHQRKLFKRREGDPKWSLDLPRRVLWYLMRLSRSDGTPGQEPTPDMVASSDGGLETLVDRLDLREALKKLTDAQREVLALRFFVGLGTTEIAQVMGKDPAAVYSLEARALLALRKRLE